MSARWLDLGREVAETLAGLEGSSDALSVTEVLTRVGVEAAFILEPAGPELDAPTLGRFELEDELGVGGMGRVLAARDPELRRHVALKILREPRRVTRGQLTRLVGEAQLTAQLEHPNVVPVHEMGVSERCGVYFAMKRVQGRSLRQVLDALGGADEGSVATFGRHRLLSAFVQVCQAVAYAHERGVLHRDIKPDNVMLGPFGEVLLMDWGVARLLAAPPEELTEVREPEPEGRDSVERVTLARTLDGATVGTPGYMAPEQARGQLDLLDGRADVWSLGALLFELLTLERAWQADDVWVLMHLAATADPPDPRERSPHRGVADEIAEICLRAMASEPDERFAGAAELAGAVQDFLEGSRRRERAARHLQEAERLREAWRGVAGVRVGLERRLEELESTVPAWAPLEDKAELFAVRARLEGLPAERAGLFADHVAAAERALAQDPDSEQARSVLAQAWFVRLEEAEEARRSEERILCEGQLERYDDGAFRARLRAGGRLSLATDPEGAEALLQRFDRRPLVWSFGPPRSLGRTPLRDVELSPGSYLLTLRAPGCRDTRYPVLIERGERWHAGELPVPLYSDAEIGPGQLYVPRGTCLIGGDPELGRDQRPRSRAWVEGAFIARFPATMGEYCVFINDVATRDIDEAWARVPRQLGGLARGGGQMWERPAAGEPFVLPEVDREGDPWDERQPLMGISWQEAVDFAAWRAERDGLAWQLPGEALWEKAARGVDGRLYPWGDRFDASLCKTQVSREHHSHPESVDLFPGDVSVYGVRTLAGCILEWVAEAHADGDVGARVWRGGSWHRPPRSSRAASRERVSLRGAIGFVGLRLARPAPRG